MKGVAVPAVLHVVLGNTAVLVALHEILHFVFQGTPRREGCLLHVVHREHYEREGW